MFSIIFAFFGLHLAYINTPFVNYEWAYRIGSQYFLTHDSELLEQYFLNQANPLTYSLFSSIIVNIFGDHFASYRILALLGGTIVLFSLSKYKEPYLLLIVGLNPLIWIYSGRAYSELLSVGIMLLAINLQKRGVLSGLFACLAATIKYHSIDRRILFLKYYVPDGTALLPIFFTAHQFRKLSHANFKIFHRIFS